VNSWEQLKNLFGESVNQIQHAKLFIRDNPNPEAMPVSTIKATKLRGNLTENIVFWLKTFLTLELGRFLAKDFKA
jgi:hypothetical protein